MNLSENLPFSIGLSSQGKSTSLEARRLLEADQRIGQTEKGQIAPGELVPANDEPPIVVQPSVQPLHYPAPRTLVQTAIGRGNLVDMAEVHQFPDCLILPGLDHLLIISLNLHLACKAQVCAIHPSKSCRPGLDAW
jgi:hypothetical protein